MASHNIETGTMLKPGRGMKDEMDDDQIQIIHMDSMILQSPSAL